MKHVPVYAFYLRRFSEAGLVVGPLLPSVSQSATFFGRLVCVICNSNSFHSFLYIQTLHNDCSYIEDVHLLFCAHLINILSFFTCVELRHVFHPKC